MNHLLPVAPILLLLALLLSPAAALAGAKQGLSLWWSSVFPSLLPSFVCLKLAQKLGLLRLCGRHPRGQLAAVIGFSLLSGAPSGARLLHALIEDGSLSPRDGARLLPVVNGVGPVFLLSIIASELLKSSHSVLYFTSHDLFETLARRTFENEGLADQADLITDCDLLIIDDLGTELTNAFISSSLFNCVNERILREKPTIISTNLTLQDFSDIYSERTFSRIVSAYTMVKLIGKDIRIQKKFSGGY